MDRESAIRKIKETFENPFDKGCFVDFIKGLFNHIEIENKHPYSGNFIPDAFRDCISTLQRIAKYEDSDENKIDILIVNLKKKTSLEKARSMQRNFIAWYLNGSRGGVLKDAALVAFISPDSGDWRFSLVKMDYGIEASEEKIKVKQKFTPARRYSFLVGENERSHTAQSRLITVLQNDSSDPTLKDLEEAFSIEKVTKEFFEKYRKLFSDVKESLDKIIQRDQKVKSDFKKKNIETVDFSKKLLGQVVFLYFLQKKGWFGVEQNKEWGSGSKNFLRELFNKRHSDYSNFFNDILEPLFYEALRYDRSHDNNYYSKFNCRIPFLNGGLFDPINDYNWTNTDISIPDELFSNDNITKEGDGGDGILDIFDRYNFTVKEDEPLEKEVAVDPEMLGKVFENLLEVKDRKSKGTYYTPREIVHYMCQQSLINYLYTEINPEGSMDIKEDLEQCKLIGEPDSKQLKFSSSENIKEIVSKEDIEKLIKYGEMVIEHDNQVIKKRKESGRYSFKLPKSIRDNAESIDKKFAFIRVCDPAIGSGVFLVGMMNEIIRARNVLTNHIKNKKNRTIYNFKRHAIQNCLYGVDIDLGAVEIAKLRLWLSLIVDEEDIKQIKPLPNLDYKIVCGNSLLGYPYKSLGLERIEKLKNKLFNITDPNKKQKLRDKIDGEINKLLSNTKKSLGYKVDFDFKIHFSEVFHEKNGFDIVIGNPPYIQLQKNNGKLADLYVNSGFQVFNRNGDIYCLFYEKGLEITKNDSGILCYITSNKWMKTKYGEKLRIYFTKHDPLILIDLGSNIFDGAMVDTNILIIKNQENHNKLLAITMNKELEKINNLLEYLKENSRKLSNLSNEPWFIGSKAEYNLKEKIEKVGKSIKKWDININYGIKTGFNEAFIINQLTYDKLVADDLKSAEILKPVLGGKDLTNYSYKWSGLWLIDSHNGYKNETGDKVLPIEIELYPKVKKHLDKYWLKILKRQDKGITPYNLRNCAYYSEFKKDKVVWLNLNRKWKFSYVEPNMFIEASLNFISTDKNVKFLVGILSSKLHLWFFKKIGRMHDTGGFMCKIDTISNFSIPVITSRNLKIVDRIEKLVNRILTLKKKNSQANIREFEKQIDEMVYKFYGLNKEEIEIIENHNSNKK